MSLNKDSALFPAFSDRNIAVSLASSNEYIPYLAVLIRSIVDMSNKENNYDIVILHSDVTKLNQDLVHSIVEDAPNFSLRFVDITGYVAGKAFKTHKRFTVFNFYRLLIPEVLANYDVSIYFDSDIVVRADISELLAFDLEDNFVVAAKDIRLAAQYNMVERNDKYYTDKVVQMEDPYKYFCSGVMVMNLKKIREEYSADYLLTLATSQKWRYVEQDILNYLFKGHVAFFPFEWDACVTTPQNIEAFAPAELYAEYLDGLSHPKACHYAGNMTPCVFPDVMMHQYFWMYAKKTPYYEVLLERMAQNTSKRIADGTFKKYMKRLTKPPLAIRAKNEINAISCIFLPKGTKRRNFVKKLLGRDKVV